MGPPWPGVHSGQAALAAFFLLGGAFAKSAQAPLACLAGRRHGRPHAGFRPHPCRHHGHGGIYLLARLDWLYAVSPEARLIVAVCALVTWCWEPCWPWCKTDIKKILAYSTLSNLALMFLALAPVPRCGHAASLRPRLFQGIACFSPPAA
jgi:NADH-quinone oxidoreductase subunit L